MKKLLAVFFALSLVLAFTMPAAATDVKVSGSYEVWGWYVDGQDLNDDTGAADEWYNQRLRVATKFKVAKGLSLSTRFDAMEGVWQGADKIYDSNGVSNTGVQAAGLRDDSNIDWEYVYMTFQTKAGKFDVGIMSDGVYGTEFGDQQVWLPKLSWAKPFGKGFYNVFQIKKWEERDWEKATVNQADRDQDRYMDILFYFAKTWQAAFLYQYTNEADFGGFGWGKARYHVFMPYVKANFGPLYVEAEAQWIKGTYLEFYDGVRPDIDFDAHYFYTKAKYNLGGGYVGGIFAWSEGQDQNDSPNFAAGGGTATEANTTTNADWDPCLILWNSDLVKWAGNMGTVATTSDRMRNAFFYQVFGGFSPMAKLDLFASFSYAKADEVAAGREDEYGTELDLKGTYKLFDNLEYLVGFGYFWAGDFYKGATPATKIDDNYILFHKLTLNF